MEVIVRPYEQRFVWNLDWNLLRTFTVVVEQQGVTRAAEFMSVSQPTVSSALKRLESTLGQTLLDRRPGHFALTAAGEALYAQGSEMFGAVARIPNLIAAADRVVSGHIAIATTSHVVSPHYDAVLADFAARFPEVTFTVTVTDSAEVVSRVRQNTATLGLCLLRGDEESGLTHDVLYRERFGLFCGPGHPLFGRERILAEQLAGQPAVSFQTEAENGPLFHVRQLREHAQLRAEPRAVSANLLEVRRMIVAGLGIGALPLHVAREDVEAGLLWPVLPERELRETDISLVRNPKRALDRAEAVFLAELDRLIADVPLAERSYR
ncbi:LysR family transcriptional regulator [Leucobacter sp. PH1c]|uniref:LysR family transcriptional regulator n=1 Tax=Leucobacter sp. PH1c TaxID=1397278 RepID=UPI0004A831A1|nr:LysR family transcriptional regulator [Leucobacter sp. PH1c]